MKRKTNNIFLLLLLIISCGALCFFLIVPEEENFTTLYESKEVAMSTTRTQHKLPIYTPAQRTPYAAPEMTNATALPIISTTTTAYQVHRSNMHVHSVGGGVARNEGSAHTANTAHRYAPTYTPTYNRVAALPSKAIAHNYTPQALTSTQQPAMQRIGSIGSTWQDWIDDYYGSTGSSYGDLSGLSDWWNSTYGDGYTPDIFEDFYSWAESTQLPLTDGLLFSLLLAALYACKKRKK